MDQALASPARKKGWQNGGLITLNMILTIAQISSYATGYDGSMMNGLQSLTTWQTYFNNPSPGTLGLLNAIQNIGQLAALPFCAIACDKFGRVAILELRAFIILVGTALQGAAQNSGMFIAARGIIGLGLAFNITAAPLLLLELAYPTQRAPQVSIYNALWNSGAIVAAWTTYGTFRINSDWAWRIPSILQGLSSIIQLATCFFLVESPRWLVSRGKEEKARQLITKYHANGNPDDPLVNLELEEIRRALDFELEISSSTSYMAFFKTKGNRHRFFIILAVGFFSQWSGNGLTSYYLTLVMDSIGYKSEETQTLVNGLLQIWGLATSIFFSLLVNKFGRRTLFLASTMAILATFIVWTALEATYEQQTALSGAGSPGVAKGVLAMIFIYGLAFNIGWNPLQVTYVIEILPYHLRAKGLVLYNFFVACALIFNQYANPIGVTNIGWKYYIVYDVWITVELVVVYFLFIETGNMSLEQTAAILDGTDIQEKFVEGVARALDTDNREVTEVCVSAEKNESTKTITLKDLLAKSSIIHVVILRILAAELTLLIHTTSTLDQRFTNHAQTKTQAQNYLPRYLENVFFRVLPAGFGIGFANRSVEPLEGNPALGVVITSIQAQLFVIQVITGNGNTYTPPRQYLLLNSSVTTNIYYGEVCLNFTARIQCYNRAPSKERREVDILENRQNGPYLGIASGINASLFTACTTSNCINGPVTLTNNHSTPITEFLNVSWMGGSFSFSPGTQSTWISLVDTPPLPDAVPARLQVAFDTT
ncbi:hypothetical protein G7Y89_g9828 [Cudoniella acicularis]|uniref:Major facilitator superfamily (MFS) profile domain-containing protein n=1 Tax=Cudoniella acicularis TaxID=354080 RepID=A0A8H4RDX3_9HELO|nr:hypothetical protein G7Y89_g9828 [Cudoniella acicularis]